MDLREQIKASRVSQPGGDISFYDAFRMLEPRIEAVTTPRTVNAPWTHLYGIVIRACEGLERYRPELAKLAPLGFQMQHLDDLPRMMFAFAHASSVHMVRPYSERMKLKIRAEGMLLRRSMQDAVTSLLHFSRNPLTPDELDLTGEPGDRNTARDLVRLSCLIDSLSEETGRATPVPAKDREWAMVIAQALITMPTRDDAHQETYKRYVLLRKKAFSLLYDTYNVELYTAMGFVLRHDKPLLARLMPPLLRGMHPNTGKKGRKREAEVSPASAVTRPDWWEE